MTALLSPRCRSGKDASVRALLLHGLGGSVNDWDQCVLHSSEKLEVWDVELPWGTFGNRKWATNNDICPTVAAAIEALPSRSTDNTVDIVVAHSFSASVVLELLSDHSASGTVQGLVLVSPSVVPEPFDWSEVARRVEQFPNVLEESIARKSRRLGPERRHTLALRLRDLIGPLAWLKSLEYVLRNSVLDLSALTIPVLIIAGDSDRAVPLSGPKRLAERMPCAAFTTLAGCGHFPMIERPDRFMALVEEFACSLNAKSPSLEVDRIADARRQLQAERTNKQVIK